jgi:myo-inositol-1(or 4)-monophosphatase
LPGADLQLLLAAAQKAGEVAQRYARNGAQAWEKPDHSGPVTEADLAVNALLFDMLGSARPNYGWLSEETEDDQKRLGAEHCFVIDPIDGTRSFIAGEKTWAHSLAITTGSDVTAAVIALPMLGLTYYAEQGSGAFLNQQAIHVSDCRQIDDATLLAAKPALEARHWRLPLPAGLQRRHKPSLAYRMALVAQGKFDAMITLRDTWDWDICAGALIAAEAGARVSDKAGKPLLFNRSDVTSSGVLAANPPLHQQFKDALDL